MANPMLLICLWRCVSSFSSFLHQTDISPFRRDNEVASDHIVETDLLANLPRIDLTINLEPLTLANVSAFVSSALRNPDTPPGTAKKLPGERVDANVRRLSELILQKTNGSPLFVAQLLKTFNAEGLFTFDFSSGRWQYDLDGIASKSVSTNVVGLLQAQMAKYSPLAQEALKVAACLGNEELQAETLAQASNRTIEQISHDLHEAVLEGLLVPYGEIRLPEDDDEMEDGTIGGLTSVAEGGSGAEEAPKSSPTRKSSPAKGKEKEKGGRVAHLKRPALTKRKASIVQKAPVPRSYRFFHDRAQQGASSFLRANFHLFSGTNRFSFSQPPMLSFPSPLAASCTTKSANVSSQPSLPTPTSTSASSTSFNSSTTVPTSSRRPRNETSSRASITSPA
jgi:predicted ATPase